MRKTIALMLSIVLSVSLASCRIQEKTAVLSSADQMVDENRTENNTGAVPESVTENNEENVTGDNEGNSEGDATGSIPVDPSRVLIAYFSVPEGVDVSGVDAVAGASIVVDDDEKMGSTQFVAQTIKETIGGDLFRIETVEDYPLQHEALVDKAADEQDENDRPELATHIENFDQYGTILLGFPNWWGDMPMAVYSFLEEYEFGDKTVIPFITHGGSRASNTLNSISRIQPGAIIPDNELVLSRNDVSASAEEVSQWAEGLKNIIVP